MKKNSVLSMLFAGMFLFASAGVALANMDEMPASDRPQSDETSIYPPNSWQYEGPVDTGNLPPGEDLSNAQSGVTDEFPLHEGGGIQFREGVDTE